MSSELKKKTNMNSPPLLLPPPLVINRDRVRTIAAAPLPPRSVKIALCKNQAARVGCCVFFVFLSLVFIWSVGKKDLSPPNEDNGLAFVSPPDNVYIISSFVIDINFTLAS